MSDPNSGFGPQLIPDRTDLAANLAFPPTRFGLPSRERALFAASGRMTTVVPESHVEPAHYVQPRRARVNRPSRLRRRFRRWQEWPFAPLWNSEIAPGFGIFLRCHQKLSRICISSRLLLAVSRNPSPLGAPATWLANPNSGDVMFPMIGPAFV